MNITRTIQARPSGALVIWQAPWAVQTETGNGKLAAGCRVEGTAAQRVIAAVLLTMPGVTREAFFSAGRHARQVQAREVAAWLLKRRAGWTYGAVAGALHRDHRMVAEAVRRADCRRLLPEYRAVMDEVERRAAL